MNLSVPVEFTKPAKWLDKLWQITAAQMAKPNARTALYSVAKRTTADSPNDCKTSLMGVIESQIIPRLLEAHPQLSESTNTLAKKARLTGAMELQAFVDLCLNDSVEKAILHVDHLVKEQGVPQEDIFLELIAPAARHMGASWEEDTLDFAEVTLGLMRLQQITHHIGYEYQGGPQKAGPVRRVMLASAPGSQHILGLAIVSEFFRKDGWQVVVEIATSQIELCHAAKNEWFDLIGLSVGLVEQIDGLPELIRTVKKASRNPETPVILGGPAFSGKEFHAPDLGANGVCIDPIQGLNMAAALVNMTKLLPVDDQST